MKFFNFYMLQIPIKQSCNSMFVQVIKKFYSIILLTTIFEVYSTIIINNFYIYSNILGIVNYLWVGKRKTYFQNISPRLLLYFYSWLVSRTSWFLSSLKKKKKKIKGGKNFHFISKLSIIHECVADFSRISSETWIFRPDPEISALVIHEPTLLPLPLLYPVLAFRGKKKKKGKEEGGNREEKKKNCSSCDILADLYHVSLKNSRVSRKIYVESFILFYLLFPYSS